MREVEFLLGNDFNRQSSAVAENILSDAEILDVILAAAARNFFSKILDATGAEPDAVYLDLEPQLREALVKGRAFEAMS